MPDHIPRQPQANQASRLSATLGRINHTILCARDQQALFACVCQVAIDVGKFQLAWIGAPDPVTKRLHPVAQAGETGYLDGIYVCVEPAVAQSQGPIGIAIRENRVVTIDDITTDPSMRPWSEAAQRHGIRSAVAVAISRGGIPVAAFALYARAANAFGKRERSVVEEIGATLSSALDNFARDADARTEAERSRIVADTFELIATNAPIDRVMERIVALVEGDSPDTRCIISRAMDRVLHRCCVGKEIPERLVASIEGTEIGASIVSEIETGEWWHRRRPAAIAAGFRSSWALPIFSRDGGVGGIFECFFKTPRKPTPKNLQVLREAAHLASIVFERMRDRELLEHQALYDFLTNLPNRALFSDRFRQAAAVARRNRLLLAVGILDLDRFKIVNDTLGHHIGDQLLQQVATRLSSAMRAGTTIARMGGDEFLILLGEIRDTREITAVGYRLLEVLESHFTIGNSDIFVSASVGFTLMRDDDENVGRLLQRADAAMYRAKRTGSACVVDCSEVAERTNFDPVQLETGLHRALENDELELHFQPQVDVVAKTVVGMEALLRWRHPVFGLLNPGEFIALAEETGLILPFGAWVIREACLQAKLWHVSGYPIRMAVNVSMRQFAGDDLVMVVQNALAASSLDGSALELELTESTLTGSSEATAETLEALRAFGVSIVIDDFGTGFSSLSYLQQFPIDALKIDRAFVLGIGERGESRANTAQITHTIIALAQSLDLRMVAEGVETETQCTFLLNAGCPMMQGYLFSEPMPVTEATAWLRDSAILAAFAPPRANIDA